MSDIIFSTHIESSSNLDLWRKSLWPHSRFFLFSFLVVFCGGKLHLRIPCSIFFFQGLRFELSLLLRFNWYIQVHKCLVVSKKNPLQHFWCLHGWDSACVISCLHDSKLKTSGKILITRFYQFVILHAALTNLYNNHLIITTLRRLFSCMRGFLGCVAYWTGQ